MIYEVEINGRTRRVEVEPAENGYLVTVDGHRHVADVTPIDGAFSLILGPAEAGPHDVQSAGPHEVKSAGAHDVKSAGPHDVKSAGTHDVRSAGSHDVRSADPHDVRSAGPHDVQSARPRDVPSVASGFSRKSYEIAIAEDPPASGNLTVHVNGRVVTASVGASRGSRTRREDEGAAAGKGPQAVVAPMPGKVVKLLVKLGDHVAARQGVVVVEAMKMENELRSPKAGTVAEVKTTEGASVDAGTALVVIE